MDFSRVVRSRRMIRSYLADRPVPRVQLDAMLDLARRAPSAGHTQGCRFLVLDDITSRDNFWSATADEADDGTNDVDVTDETVGTVDTHGADVTSSAWLARMREAPALIVVLVSRSAYLDRYAEPDKGWTDREAARWPIPYWYVDGGMAAMTLLLAAADAELGACFFGVPGERWAALRTSFAVPDEYDPVGVISVGHPAPDRRSPSLRRGRLPRGEVIRYGTFEAPG